MNRTNDTRRAAFERYGRAYHLRVEHAADLRVARVVDPALWAATSMPTRNLHAEAALLSHIDADQNGRITHAEVCAAIAWLFDVLGDDAPVDERRDYVDPATFRSETPEADRIKRIAERIAPGSTIGLDEIRRRKDEIAARPVSATGIVLPEAAADPALEEVVRLAISVSGGTVHPSGANGLDSTTLDRFVTLAARYRELADAEESMKGDVTTYRRFSRLYAKLDEYYELCARYSIDGGAKQGVPTADGGERPLATIALSKPDSDGVLRFDSFVNPYWQADLEAFRSEVLSADPGTIPETMTATEWRRVRERFTEPRRVADELEQIGSEALRTLRSADDGRGDGTDGAQSLIDRARAPESVERIRGLIRSATEAEITLDEITLLERLVLYQISLIDMAANFVAFSRLYDLRESAWLDMGRLVLDGRTFNLVVPVENRAKHVVAAKNSSMFVLYLQVRRARDVPLYEIAVPVTAGGRGNLAVGKRGIFLDRAGVELDAEIVEIIDNPISVTEAIVSPIKRLGKSISGKIESITTSADKELQQYAGTAVDAIGTSPQAGTPPPVPVSDGRGRIGTALLGGSLAVAAIGSALAYITSTISSAKWWHILAGLGVALFAVVVPTIALAMMKLRARDLSAVIEASGWALNIRMRLNRRLSRLFTVRAIYPRDARGTPARRRRWVLIGLFFVLIVIAVVLGISLLEARG